MSKHPLPEQDLIDKIDAALVQYRIRPTAFGKHVANDGKLIADLRNGRELRRATRQKILDAIAALKSDAA